MMCGYVRRKLLRGTMESVWNPPLLLAARAASSWVARLQQHCRHSRVQRRAIRDVVTWPSAHRLPLAAACCLGRIAHRAHRGALTRTITGAHWRTTTEVLRATSVDHGGAESVESRWVLSRCAHEAGSRQRAVRAGTVGGWPTSYFPGAVQRYSWLASGLQSLLTRRRGVREWPGETRSATRDWRTASRLYFPLKRHLRACYVRNSSTAPLAPKNTQCCGWLRSGRRGRRGRRVGWQRVPRESPAGRELSPCFDRCCLHPRWRHDGGQPSQCLRCVVKLAKLIARSAVVIRISSLELLQIIDTTTAWPLMTFW